MIFTSPIPFDEALESVELKAILPTAASTFQLRRIAPELRARAFFSARTTNAWYLGRMHEMIGDLVGARRTAEGILLNPAEVRTQLKESLNAIGYDPEAAGVKPGSLKDLSSDARLNLIIDTQEKMAAGYGSWAQGQNAAVLDQWPAQELYRAEGRKEPRDWISCWRDVGGQFYGGGRMIALKNDQIWTRVSAFGLPYPPFDFNSGMDVADVTRDEAIDFGLIDRDTKIQPQERPFNEGLEAASPVERQTALFTALLESLGPQVEFSNGAFRFLS